MDDVARTKAWHPVDPNGRWTTRRATYTTNGLDGVRGERCYVLPNRVMYVRDVGSRPASRDGSCNRTRGDRTGRGHRPRPRGQHEALAALRAQLRVLL